MAGYLSSILTSTTSRYNNLRRNLLSDESDGDTEDNSHISRVLRAYYTEKGRPLPAWLPPDPNAHTSTRSQSSQSIPTQQPHRPSPAPTQGSRTRSALSDLWDSPSQPTPQPQSTQSLRGSAARSALGNREGSSYFGSAATQRLPPPTGGRPLPSHREGSYQDPTPPARLDRSTSSFVGGTAQDKLKAKLWGAPRQ